MIISRTPLRISFVGGGSDIAAYYKKSPGAVISTAINKYIYITVNKKFDNKIRASYSETEIVTSVDDLKHEYIRECLRRVGITGGIEITSISDIPSEGTGLGSSCSFIVGLLHALYAYVGKYVTAEKLATEACEIEIDILKKPIGKQDQYIAAYGGMQYIRFYADETVRIDPIICTPDTKLKLQKRLLLLYTGLTRSTAKILAKQKNNLTKQKQQKDHMDHMVSLATVLAQDLQKNDLTNFGKLLDENWQRKRTMAKEISTPQIDKWYEIAKKNGAEGGKILGAGGGGFLLLYALPKYHKQIIQALPELTPMKFSFEPQGSKIIFVSE